MSVQLKQLLDDKGKPINVDSKIGAGGEGAVFGIKDRPDCVVKIYHKMPSEQQISKLRAMSETASEKLLSLSTWPLSLVRSDAGDVLGFIMPRLKPNYKEVLQLFSPANRKKTFPEADYSFIVHTAMNIAAAFGAVHAAGHVIGDVNQKNILVNGNALSMMVDCDSFQITNPQGRIFPCAVGVAEFTPPELQHKDLKEELRTFNHDNFGLAVLIFHLLFMGRHPFAGKYLGTGDPPDLEQAIGSYLFAYRRQSAHQRYYVPPPLSVPVSIFPDSIMNLFETAFCRDSGVLPIGSSQLHETLESLKTRMSHEGPRPSAEDWRVALKQFKESLISCGSDEHHKFPKSCCYCPWCKFDEHGTHYFGAGSFDLDKLGSLAEAGLVTKIEDALKQVQPMMAVFEHPPGPQRLIVQSPAQNGDTLTAIMVFLISLICFCAAVHFPQLFVFGISFLAIAAVISSGQTQPTGRVQLEKLSVDLLLKFENLQQDLKREIDATDLTLLRNFKSSLAKYNALDDEFKSKINMVKEDSVKAQEKEYLSHFPVDLCPGLSHFTLSTLRSYSINTAADLSRDRLKDFRWLGDAAFNDLIKWKRELKSKFHPTNGKVVSTQVVNGIVSAYKHKALDLEMEMKAGKDQIIYLESKYQPIASKFKQLDSIRKELVQTNAKLKKI